MKSNGFLGERPPKKCPSLRGDGKDLGTLCVVRLQLCPVSLGARDAKRDMDITGDVERRGGRRICCVRLGKEEESGCIAQLSPNR